VAREARGTAAEMGPSFAPSTRSNMRPPPP
jgi:hypothetical protein